MVQACSLRLLHVQANHRTAWNAMLWLDDLSLEPRRGLCAILMLDRGAA